MRGIDEAAADLAARLGLQPGQLSPAERRARMDRLKGEPSEDGHRQTIGPWQDAEGHLWHFALHWQPVNGRLECIGIELISDDATPVSTAVVRGFPLGRALTESRRVGTELHRWHAEQVASEAKPELYRRAREWSDSKGPRSGPKGYPPEHYAEVAAIYREADGYKPTLAVAEHWTVSPSAAAKWVARCRTMGLLPATSRGRAS